MKKPKRISQKEMKRRYSSMIAKEKKRNPSGEFEPITNCYTCQICKHVTKAIDVDDGLTPMTMKCVLCGNIADSGNYSDDFPEKLPIVEYYRPTEKELMKKHRLNHSLLEHVFKGGLLRRFRYYKYMCYDCKEVSNDPDGFFGILGNPADENTVRSSCRCKSCYDANLKLMKFTNLN